MVSVLTGFTVGFAVMEDRTGLEDSSRNDQERGRIRKRPGTNKTAEGLGRQWRWGKKLSSRFFFLAGVLSLLVEQGVIHHRDGFPRAELRTDRTSDTTFDIDLTTPVIASSA